MDAQAAYFSSYNRCNFMSLGNPPREKKEPSSVLHWFRLDSLRISDNPAFHHAVSSGERLRAIVIIDSWFNSNTTKSSPGANVWRFLLEALHDLDNRLQKVPYKTRLNVYIGQPITVLPKLFAKWNVSKLTFQSSQTSMEAAKYDDIIRFIARDHSVEPVSFWSHTLYAPDLVLKTNNGMAPKSYREFRRLLPYLGRPEEPCPEPNSISVMLNQGHSRIEAPDGHIPTLQDLGFGPEEALYTNSWIGGETEALTRLSSFCSKRATQCDDPVSLLMNKDSLSPYLRLGCLSVRQFFSQLHQYGSTSGKGQVLFEEMTRNLLLREFAFHVGNSVPGFDEMKNNPLCIQMPWDDNEEFLKKWREGKTGYPWIDAIMRQIRQDGFAHFIARQSIAVFLTRGYLWVNWERGKEFFQEFMLDFELPVSTMCWMQASCSGFFCQNIESYDPCQIGKQMDIDGFFIKTFVPELKDFPADYIHTPWNAPKYIQKQAGCFIGEDYPAPIVDLCQQGTLCCKRVQMMMQALHEAYSDLE